MDRVNPMQTVSCKLYARDWNQTVLALRELAQIKYNALMTINATDQQWDEVVELRTTADKLEIEFLQGVIK